MTDLDRTKQTLFYLSDPWFTPSLNWLLSRDTKVKIELRSNGEAKAKYEVCCLMKPLPSAAPDPTPGDSRRKRRRADETLLVAKWEEVKKLNDHPVQRSGDPTQPTWEVMKFVPNNAGAFETVLKLIKEGDEKVTLPTTAAAN